MWVMNLKFLARQSIKWKSTRESEKCQSNEKQFALNRSQFPGLAGKLLSHCHLVRKNVISALIVGLSK